MTKVNAHIPVSPTNPDPTAGAEDPNAGKGPPAPAADGSKLDPRPLGNRNELRLRRQLAMRKAQTEEGGKRSEPGASQAAEPGLQLAALQSAPTEAPSLPARNHPNDADPLGADPQTRLQANGSAPPPTTAELATALQARLTEGLNALETLPELTSQQKEEVDRLRHELNLQSAPETGQDTFERVLEFVDKATRESGRMVQNGLESMLSGMSDADQQQLRTELGPDLDELESVLSAPMSDGDDSYGHLSSLGDGESVADSEDDFKTVTEGDDEHFRPDGGPGGEQKTLEPEDIFADARELLFGKDDTHEPAKSETKEPTAEPEQTTQKHQVLKELEDQKDVMLKIAKMEEVIAALQAILQIRKKAWKVCLELIG